MLCSCVVVLDGELSRRGRRGRRGGWNEGCRPSHLAFGCLFHLWVHEPHMPEVACFFAVAERLRFGQVLSQFAQPGFDFFLTLDTTSFLSRSSFSIRGRHLMHLQRDVQYLISHLLVSSGSARSTGERTEERGRERGRVSACGVETMRQG